MKAILVVDVEEYGDYYADVYRKDADDRFEGRYCLKPLPQKKNTSKLQGFGYSQIMWTNKTIHQNEGWNACLDEILGETE